MLNNLFVVTLYASESDFLSTDLLTTNEVTNQASNQATSEFVSIFLGYVTLFVILFALGFLVKKAIQYVKKLEKDSKWNKTMIYKRGYEQEGSNKIDKLKK